MSMSNGAAWLRGRRLKWRRLHVHAAKGFGFQHRAVVCSDMDRGRVQSSPGQPQQRRGPIAWQVHVPVPVRVLRVPARSRPRPLKRSGAGWLTRGPTCQAAMAMARMQNVDSRWLETAEARVMARGEATGA